MLPEQGQAVVCDRSYHASQLVSAAIAHTTCPQSMQLLDSYSLPLCESLPIGNLRVKLRKKCMTEATRRFKLQVKLCQLIDSVDLLTSSSSAHISAQYQSSAYWVTT